MSQHSSTVLSFQWKSFFFQILPIAILLSSHDGMAQTVHYLPPALVNNVAPPDLDLQRNYSTLGCSTNTCACNRLCFRISDLTPGQATTVNIDLGQFITPRNSNVAFYSSNNNMAIFNIPNSNQNTTLDVCVLVDVDCGLVYYDNVAPPHSPRSTITGNVNSIFSPNFTFGVSPSQTSSPVTSPRPFNLVYPLTSVISNVSVDASNNHPLNTNLNLPSSNDVCTFSTASQYTYQLIKVRNGQQAIDLATGSLEVAIGNHLLGDISAIYWGDNTNGWFRAAVPNQTANSSFAGTTLFQNITPVIGMGLTTLTMDQAMLRLITSNSTLTAIGVGQDICFWVEYNNQSFMGNCGQTIRIDVTSKPAINHTPPFAQDCIRSQVAESAFTFLDNSTTLIRQEWGEEFGPCLYFLDGYVNSATTPVPPTGKIYYIIKNTGPNPIASFDLSFWDAQSSIYRYLIDANAGNNTLQAFAYQPTGGTFNLTTFLQGNPQRINTVAIDDNTLRHPNQGPNMFYRNIRVNHTLNAGAEIVLVWDAYKVLPSVNSCNQLNGNALHWRLHYMRACGIPDVWRFQNDNDPNQSHTINEAPYTPANPHVLEYGRLRYGGMAGISGPGLTNMIGNPDDDYPTAPGTAEYTLPPITSQSEFLPSVGANSAYIVRLKMDHRVNLWRGDVNNNMYRTGTATAYNTNHLQTSVSFFNDAGTPVVPHEIFYGGGATININITTTPLGTFPVGGNYYPAPPTSTAYQPTANNSTHDVVYAVFRVASWNDLAALSSMRVKYDLEPVCNSGTYAIARSTPGAPTLDFTGAAEMELQVLFSPNHACDADPRDNDLLVQGESGLLPIQNNPMPAPQQSGSMENKYVHACKANPDRIQVQCPGCKISGMYTNRAILSRVTFGHLDNDNNGVADDANHKLTFDQARFMPVNTGNNTAIPSLSTTTATLGDLFRIRHSATVNLDMQFNSNGGTYAPSAQTLNHHVQNTSHFAYDSSSSANSGFKHCYLSVEMPDTKKDWFESYGHANASGTSNLTNCIANIIVWLGHDPNGEPNTPVLLFWDDTRDFTRRTLVPITDTTYEYVGEFVFDISHDRLSLAYQQQYNGASIPIRCFHHGLNLDIDVTFRVVQNVAFLPAADALVAFSSRAYFTLSPETSDSTNIDMQDVLGSQPPIFESYFALEDLPNRLGGSALSYPSSFPATYSRSHFYPNLALAGRRLDQVRWWCIKGFANLNLVGVDMRYPDPIVLNDRSPSTEQSNGQPIAHPAGRNPCGFRFLDGDNKGREYRLRLVNGATQTDLDGTSGTFYGFPGEYRHWARWAGNTWDVGNWGQPSHGLTQFPIFPMNNPNTNRINNANPMQVPYLDIDDQQSWNTTPSANLNSVDDGDRIRIYDFLFPFSSCAGQPVGTCFNLRNQFQLRFPTPLDYPSGPASIFHRGGFASRTPDMLIPSLRDCANDTTPRNENYNLNTTMGSLLPFYDGHSGREKVTMGDVYQPGRGHISLTPPQGPTNLGSHISWRNSVYYQNTYATFPSGNPTRLNPLFEVGNAPNPWVLIEAPAGWSVPANGVIARINTTAVVALRTWTIGAGTYILGLAANAQWVSYQGVNTTLWTGPRANGLEINLAPDCGNITALAAPRVMVGFTCSPANFPNGGNYGSIADLVTAIQGSSCDFNGWTVLPAQIPVPIMEITASLSQPAATQSFICDPTILELDINNNGSGCLGGVGTSLGDPDNLYLFVGPQYTPPGSTNNTASPYELVNNGPCSNGLGASENTSFSISIYKNCNLSYDTADRIRVSVDAEWACGQTPLPYYQERLINPYLDNPDNTFNNFAIDSTIHGNTCPFSLSIPLRNLMLPDSMGGGSIGAHRFGPDNLLVVSAPSWLMVTGGSLNFIDASGNVAASIPVPVGDIRADTLPILFPNNAVEYIDHFGPCASSNPNSRPWFISLPANSVHLLDNHRVVVELTLAPDSLSEITATCTPGFCTALYTLRNVACEAPSPITEPCQLFEPQGNAPPTRFVVPVQVPPVAISAVGDCDSILVTNTSMDGCYMPWFLDGHNIYQQDSFWVYQTTQLTAINGFNNGLGCPERLDTTIVLDCCPPMEDYFLVGDGLPNPIATLKNAMSILPITGNMERFQVIGNFSLDTSLYFVDCEFRMNPAASMDVSNKAVIVMSHCQILASCDEMWKHIDVYGELTLKNG